MNLGRHCSVQPVNWKIHCRVVEIKGFICEIPRTVPGLALMGSQYMFTIMLTFLLQSHVKFS